MTPSPQPGPKKRWQNPHQPGGHSGASPLTLTGWLAPGHASPGHLLSAVQDAPAAALGRVALHWGEASVLCPAGRAVAGAGSPGGDSPLEHFTEARALASPTSSVQWTDRHCKWLPGWGAEALFAGRSWAAEKEGRENVSCLLDSTRGPDGDRVAEAGEERTSPGPFFSSCLKTA